MRETKANKRSGVLAIMLPNHPEYLMLKNRNKYNPNNIPARVADNIQNNYIDLIPYPDSANHSFHSLIHKEIDEAYDKSEEINPINNRPLRRRNNER
jgi:hypothetical protein